MNEQQIIEWLKINYPRYNLISWAGNSSSKSVFLDIKRGVEFSCSLSIFKRNLKRNPDTIFSPTKEEKSKLYLECHTKKYGGVHYTQTKEYLEKRENTTMQKYGVKNVMQSEKIKENFKKTFIEKYGVSHPSQVEEIHKRQIESIKKSTKQSREKFKNTSLEKYGTDNPHKSLEVINKTKQTNIAKFGGAAPISNSEVKNKIENTNIKKYGNKHYFASDEGKKKVINSKIENGSIRVYENKLISQIAEEKGFSFSHFNLLIRQIGLDEALKLTPNRTSIESKIEEILKEFNVEFVFNKFLNKDNKYRPDFVIPSKNLIIEANGLYWHSDAIIKDKNYHKKKKDYYCSLGYNSLFFTDFEIFNKTNIVKSVIQNKLGLSERVFARKCFIQELDSDTSEIFSRQQGEDFFQNNHLMGKGVGNIVALFDNNMNIVAAVQYKLKNKDTGTYEISRFCTKNGISIVGGFSKLIKFIERKHTGSMKQIITFIDKRYGFGDYLNSLGFSSAQESLSFAWTNGYEPWHRMRFPGSSGYDSGLFKIWDCGQAKYIKITE